MIPERVKRAIDLHAREGRPCGHFVTAVLENNLRNAIGHADPDSLAALSEIVQYAHFEIPGNCWGSAEAVRHWRSIGGLEGLEREKLL